MSVPQAGAAGPLASTDPPSGRSGARPTPLELLHGLAGSRDGRLTHVHQVPERVAEHADWPDWVAPPLYAALAQSGVADLWSHQREAADAVAAGEHVVLSTGTASGKSLGFLLPVLSGLIDGSTAPNGRGATALYLSPTKALAQDQLHRIERLALPGVRAATYDGDTPTEERRWIRDHASYVLTNPDLVHHSLLPGHAQWAPFLRALRYVVVDECHVYRGVFGSQLALLLRRLRRVAARYRSEPVFVLASATVADPATHAAQLVGMPVRAVTRDGSPRAALTFGLWDPSVTDVPAVATGPAAPTGAVDEQAQKLEQPAHRRSAVGEAAELLSDLVSQGVQTVAFGRSRSGVEVISAVARRHLAELDAALPGVVAAYRGGYLPEERRALEQDLRDGSLVGLAATNALELGIDVTGLDAVLLAGWPGTRASLWQQAGRAGRAGEEALAVLLAADDPLDTYLVHHPEAIFGSPVEGAVLDPSNPYLLGPHLAAAAAELPLTEGDEALFGPTMMPLLDRLVTDGVLRRRPRGWFWAHAERASDQVSLRGTGGVVGIVDQRTGRVLGTVDDTRAHSAVHTGAVYLHQGEPYVVLELDLEQGCALVVPGDPGWSTQARSVSTFVIGDHAAHGEHGDHADRGDSGHRGGSGGRDGSDRARHWQDVDCCFGSVLVHTQVTSFLRRLPSGEVIGEHPLDLPVRTLPTKGVWWTLTDELLAAAGIAEEHVPGAAHAAEHAAIGMLPLVATSDRWDVGGVSTARHPDTGLPTILVYDGYPGGAGFAERGFDAFVPWLTGTRDAVAGCRCVAGCPACVQSPKCGNGNEPLDKARAVALLDVTLAAARG